MKKKQKKVVPKAKAEELLQKKLSTACSSSETFARNVNRAEIRRAVAGEVH